MRVIERARAYPSRAGAGPRSSGRLLRRPLPDRPHALLDSLHSLLRLAQAALSLQQLALRSAGLCATANAHSQHLGLSWKTPGQHARLLPYCRMAQDTASGMAARQASAIKLQGLAKAT